jgi:hypothetical protein
MGYLSFAGSIVQFIAFITFFAISIGFLLTASLQISKAYSIVGKVIGLAFRAISIGISYALWVS